jgi:hypothetical protein
MNRLEESEKKRIAEHNHVRVEARRMAYQKRLDELRLQNLLAQSEKEQRQEALAQFFDVIRKKLGAERDPSRVVQPTAASSQAEGYVPVREATSTRIYGFASEQVMKDPRFKLHSALVAAGLHQTSYARQLLSQGFRQHPLFATSIDNPLRQ